ncbi:MAG TPA: hypothetical protein VJB92_03495 [Candidatus Paceibacterota bacterium]
MIEFLKVAALVMAFVSMVLELTGFIMSRSRSRAYQFICGGSSFVTTIVCGCLMVLEASVSAYLALGILWFVTGSLQFARATFPATE